MLSKVKWGVHPDTRKTATEGKPIESNALPERVVIPVRQHLGAPCEPVVKKGDVVKKGQRIAAANAPLASHIHASLSGTVIEVADKPHPGLGQCPAIVIENDGQDAWEEGLLSERSWEKLSKEELLELIKNAGIVGLGGATFPVHIKLLPPKDSPIDTLIINAAECEPFLTADHRTMLEHSELVVTGVLIIQKVLSVKNVYIGIEDNKPDAVKVMQEACQGTGVQVRPIPTRYPHGAEKMIIKTLAQREVPSGKLPMSVGVVVQNVGTAMAIGNAVKYGIPLIERIVTVSGGAVKEPKNLRLRIGTSFQDAIAQCGGFSFQPDKILMGGPFMGVAQYTLEVPVIKGTNGILLLGKKELNSDLESACIRCGRCIEACPMGLNPSMLSILGERGMIDEAKNDYQLLDCMECGCCSFVCPAKRKIVQYVRYSKKLAAEKGGK
ncbi:MAG: electron transport complex subunit RsxC [Peptococcaceae bacterium]|jgi:electron transport complex protein RnfC|nr:electron transport complex subunit RsxC [Peptococcaceae bacterium]